MLTYDKAANLMLKARNGHKRLANNTYLRRVDIDNFAVCLHSTDVVTLHPDGSYTLRTGGWQTPTTKDRINEYSPARVSQRKFEWFVRVNGAEAPFFEGMTIRA